MYKLLIKTFQKISIKYNIHSAISQNTANPNPAPKVTPLFRSEVLAAHSGQWLGSIHLAQPISSWIIAAVSISIAICLFAYIACGSITKKARVAGITVPISGSLSILAPNAGVLVRSHVSEGQQVTAGQILFELSTERQGDHGEITALVSQQLEIRKQTLAAEHRLRIVQDGEKRRALDGRILNIDAETSQLEQEITLAERRQKLAQKSVEKYEILQKGGFVSSAQTQQKQEDLIDIESRLSSLSRTKVQLQANHLILETDRMALVNALATDLGQLQRAEASLDQESAENQNRKTSLIVAPQTGVMTAVTYQPGQAVNAGQAVATLIPAVSAAHVKNANELEVHLYAPSRTAGFIAPGQTVLIRYQSYPYQKFGLQAGVLFDISKTPFAPNELPSNLASTILSNAQQSILGFNSNESLYRLKVKLKRQSITAYGQEQLLKPGMTLEADVVQDKRKIWEWIAEPLLAVFQR